MDHENRMRGDAEFARWYTTHHDRIRSLCARILRDDAAGEDLAQETLLKAWTRRESIREEDVGAWLTVVARNLCISYMRRHGRVVPTDVMPEVPDAGADPLANVERLESRRAVRRAMREINERQRRALYLHEVNGADYEELGHQFGLSPEGVRSIAFRARTVLRARLVAAGEGFSAMLLGVRIRIRGAAQRVRTSSLSSGGGVAWQAGINLALAVTISLANVGSPLVVARDPGSTDANFGALTRSVPVSSSRSARDARAERSATTGSPQLPEHFVSLALKPRVDPRAWDPNDGSGSYELEVAGAGVTFRKSRQENDHFDAQYRLEDWLFPTLCSHGVGVCHPN